MKSLLKSEWMVHAAMALLFSLLVLWPGAWRTAAEDGSAAFFARLRGDRDLDDRVFFISISPQDVQDLGGWPISRDYYGFLVQALTGAGARLIALDLLMENPQRAYPEFDRIFAGYLETSGIVCLPMAYGRFDSPPGGARPLYQAGEPAWPCFLFRPHLAGCGFSNLPGAGTIHRLPLLADEQDTLRLSFGAEIARQYWGGASFTGSGAELILRDERQRTKRIPLDGHGQLRLNPVRGERLEQAGLVETLRMLRDPSRPFDFNGKLVFIGVTAPGLAVSKSTALNPALPAPLLQLIAAETILSGRWLAPVPALLQIIILLLLAAALALFAARDGLRRLFLTALALLILIFIAGLAAFYLNRILPLFYPATAVVLSTLYTALHRLRRERVGTRLLQEELKAALAGQTRQLQTAKEELAALEKEMAEGVLAANRRDTSPLFARQQEIAELESRISDLSALRQPGPQETRRKYDLLYHPESPMAEVVRMIDLLTPVDLTVIIQGETGTGKELVARAIHQGGSRCNAPFMAVNCSALPETLLESELFGHEKGSFTGAIALRKGLFEQADGGTLFLDEISETSPAFQASLLRVLQERVVQRLGGVKTIPVNVRVIAAANRDLAALVQNQQFREDLYYRLNGMTLILPALRHRPLDIPLLAGHFLARVGEERGITLSAEALALLVAWPWPGNVRELENVLRRAALFAAGDKRRVILKSDLPGSFLKLKAEPAVYLSLEEQILHSLRNLGFSHSAIALTARALGGRDRGTITEYYRGLCFSWLVRENYRIEQAARALAASSDPIVLDRVRRKMRAYVANLASAGDGTQLYKGLPQKYHPCLRQLLEHRDRIV
jgi:transcriptional regulator with GAF, ATPase, and Fis domain/CHASE2 domain-containing sensor protein